MDDNELRAWGLIKAIKGTDPNAPDLSRLKAKDVRWSEIASAVNANAREKGFWDEERNFGEMIALFHSEISEAYVALENGDVAWRTSSSGKPEGIASEIVDVIIRALDASWHMFNAMIEGAAKRGQGVPPDRFEAYCSEATDLIHRTSVESGVAPGDPAHGFEIDMTVWMMRLHAMCSMALEHDREPFQDVLAHTEKILLTILGLVMVSFEILASGRFVGQPDPVAMIHEKHRYNTTRPHKHGKTY